MSASDAIKRARFKAMLLDELERRDRLADAIATREHNLELVRAGVLTVMESPSAAMMRAELAAAVPSQPAARGFPFLDALRFRPSW